VPALSQTVTLDGGRVAGYEVIGHGPPLHFFMGGPGFSAAVLRDEAELLADQFTVYLIDPHGSGASTPPADASQYDHLGHARFYEEVNRALGIGPAAIMGESFGGIVALTFAALFPQTATHCICVASRVLGEELAGDQAAAEMEAFLARHEHQPWYPDARRAWDRWTERVLATDDAAEVDEMMAAMLPLYAADPDRPGVREVIEQWRREMKTDLQAVKVWESGLYQRIDARPLLSEIRCPTLVLVGELDALCGPAHGHVIADAIDGARLVTVPGSGHFIGVEAPARFRDEIAGFAL
jgi:pimeloyl-ACP methyl ester carboxylesterase